ncbi:methyl-accepting chemotaxis protein [Pseudoalteromonas phenolica]|uniref:Methyl-accepting chemotaxis protein n=1 Tax=Pseudoalteromonas phenolica TaxID=161398 RepID=A0A5R9Q2I1_9GAMM|nr:methyl-accepting chemotaxis protein [Pseudoalteromonas phenolica]TLX46756.1 methyl-accepting chemotaxis protein [Pseudoalteromonas phenolica]
MINTLTVQSRLILLACMPIILFIGATIFTLKEVKIIVHDLDELYDLRVIPMQEIKVVSDDYAVIIVDTFHKLRGEVVTKEQAIADILKAQEVARKNWQLYLKNVTGAEEKKLISLAEQRRGEVDHLIEQYLSEIRNNTFSSKDYSLFIKKLYSTFDPLSESFNDLINYQVKQAQLLKIEGDNEAEKVEFSLIALSVVIVFAMLSVGFLIYQSINAPLTKMAQTIEQVVRDTDLTLRVEESGNDEFSKIATDFNMMMDKFHAMLNQISSAIESLSGLSGQVAKSGEQMASSALEQEQQTAMIAQAITEMSSAIAEVSESASRTATHAEDAENLSIEGQKTIEESIGAIHELAELVVNNAQLINELNNQTTEINQVVMMIQGVAEQTNLLALNAAIEAARAGDSGRGFAVVADEVRTLAHNTQKATENIKEMISKLQTQANHAVSAMSDAENRASKSVEMAEHSSLKIQAISSSVSEIASMNIQVSTATEEQTSVTSEMSNSIEVFNLSINEISMSAQNNSVSGEELSDMAEQLKQEIKQFKV